ncbi:MAG: hypothetical protein NT069_27490 [Planctomycetota bacterium]|nr:hypothetical protein [Planctomycetota bacterium]
MSGFSVGITADGIGMILAETGSGDRHSPEILRESVVQSRWKRLLHFQKKMKKYRFFYRKSMGSRVFVMKYRRFPEWWLGKTSLATGILDCVFARDFRVFPEFFVGSVLVLPSFGRLTHASCPSKSAEDRGTAS